MTQAGRMCRLSVVGNSGAGKSRLAAELAGILGTRHIELAAIFHQKDWNALETTEFRQRVGELAAGATWVIDGNYQGVRDLVWARADTVVWLDPPRHTVMARISRRSLTRVLTGRELWNGNREQWRNVLSMNPDNSVVAWAWAEHHRYLATYLAASEDPAFGGVRFVRLGQERDRDQLLSEVRAQSASDLERSRGEAAT